MEVEPLTNVPLKIVWACNENGAGEAMKGIKASNGNNYRRTEKDMHRVVVWSSKEPDLPWNDGCNVVTSTTYLLVVT